METQDKYVASPPKPAEYEIARCGYGNLVWPDGSNIEGYWIDDYPIGMAVCRAPKPNGSTFEGIWQKDTVVQNIFVFR